MSLDFNKRFPRSTDPLSLIEFLNNSSFDDLIEADLISNYTRNIYHSTDKYFVPLLNGNHSNLFDYSLQHMIHPEDKERYFNLLNPDTLLERLKTAEYPGLLVGEFRYKLSNGDYSWVEQVVIGGERFGLREGIVRFYVFDIQSRKNRELGSTVKADTPIVKDNLTGLYNGSDFFDLANELIKNKRDDWCLIFIDLENFKLFNEWYGREAGNLLLGEIGTLLCDIEAITGGLAAYFGQDDFVLLAPYDSARIKHLYDAIHSIIVSRGNSVGFLPAFGIAMVTKDTSILDLFDRANQASHFAKENFHNRIRFFYPEMYEKKRHEYEIISDFQRALHSNEITFYLQPQCIASNKRVVGAEALTRWIKQDGTIISPGEFVPILEKYGFISDLDEYIWDSVCKWLRSILDLGLTPVPISVNVSQNDILTTDIPKHFETLIKKYDLPPKYLKIEITESVYAKNTDIVKETVSLLQEKGFLILMDDFGSGYSALSILRNLNVDILKFDAQFLRMNSFDEAKGVHIVESIVNMAKNMGLPIIFEGVETEEQRTFLRQLGCQYIQGFYFYRPMPISDFETLIKEPSNIETNGFRHNANNEFKVREFLDENIYSDAMLNNVLGPVAIYSWNDEKVDIIRFNELFYELVDVKDFSERIINIERFVPKEEKTKFYNLFRRATKDYLNGATDTITFRKSDGNEVNIKMHLYYIGDDGNNKKFYGSVQDITEIIDYNNNMNILSKFLPDCIVLVKERGNRLIHNVIIYGNKYVFGLTKEELKKELDNRSFYNRISKEEQEELKKATLYSKENKINFHASFHLTTQEGESIKMRMKVCRIDEKLYDDDYILILGVDS